MSVPATHLTADSRASLLQESQRRGEQLRFRRDLRERLAGDGFVGLDECDVRWIDEQRHQRALLEIRMRNDQLRGLPTCFGDNL